MTNHSPPSPAARTAPTKAQPLAIETGEGVRWMKMGSLASPIYEEQPELEKIWKAKNMTIPPEYLNQIIVSDALDYLRSLPAASIPLFLFSPPYNLGNSTGGGMPGAKRMGHYDPTGGMAKRGGMGKWSGGALADGYEDYSDNLPWPEYIAWQHEVLSECWRCLTPAGAIYYNHKPRILDGVLLDPTVFLPDQLPIRQRIIWARAGGTNFSTAFYCPTHEYILVVAKPEFRLKSKGASGVGDVWTVPQISGTWHPAPFPLALAERVIETVMPALVCDPFMGSGTTARAARRYRIDWIGCDKSAGYAERAQREIEATQPRAAALIAEQECFV